MAVTAAAYARSGPKSSIPITAWAVRADNASFFCSAVICRRKS